MTASNSFLMPIAFPALWRVRQCLLVEGEWSLSRSLMIGSQALIISFSRGRPEGVGCCSEHARHALGEARA